MMSQHESMMADKEVEKDDSQENDALLALAEAIKSGQEAMANALNQNTQALAQLQTLTVDAIDDISEAMSAPRHIQLQRDKKGLATGATSIVQMPVDTPVQ
jgi:hypothetical protein